MVDALGLNLPDDDDPYEEGEPEGKRRMEELKPCPFCGSNNLIVDGFTWVHCKNCRTDGPLFNDRKKAIKAWNTRKED